MAASSLAGSGDFFRGAEILFRANSWLELAASKRMASVHHEKGHVMRSLSSNG
jgi:hypothetical protein